MLLEDEDSEAAQCLLAAVPDESPWTETWLKVFVIESSGVVEVYLFRRLDPVFLFYRKPRE